MKLLQKTNRTYLILTASAFVVAGTLYYFILSMFLDSQLNEKLADSKAHFQETLSRTGLPYNDPPYLEVKEISDSLKHRDSYIDTILFDTSENEGIPFRQLTGSAKAGGRNYLITVRNTLIEKSDFLLTIFFTTLSVFLLLLICLIFIYRKLSGRIWAPFYIILDNLRKFSQENPAFTLSSPVEIEEFEELRATLNILTSRVISDYNVLKRFTEDASHEIQTPLSIIQSSLESLMQASGLTESQARQIQAAYNATGRLSKLTRSMLFLSRIENRQFSESSEINIELLFRNYTDLLSEVIQAKNLTINITKVSECIITANNLLAESLVSNIYGNAVKHSLPGTNINIELTNNSFAVSNEGRALDVDTQKLFDRFYKANDTSDSFGLGLSIVKEICKGYNWDITYSVEGNLHNVRILF